MANGLHFWSRIQLHFSLFSDSAKFHLSHYESLKLDYIHISLHGPMRNIGIDYPIIGQ